jgi:anti-sigma factor RsiW
MNADVHALTGAYVLDAVSDEERAAFERHLAECETCAQEVVELRETATRLARAASEDPPPRLREAVLASIREVRQDPPHEPRPARVTRLTPRRWPLRLTATAAAVFLAVAASLGVLLAREQDALEAARAQTQAVAEILRADDATVTTVDESGARMTLVASKSEDRLYLLTEGLAAPPDGHTYQAWVIGDEFLSAGLLNPDDGRASLDVHGINAGQALGITIEPAGGSAKPSGEPVMTFEL